MLVVRNSADEVLLARRPPTGVWAGLWSLPEIDIGDDPLDWCHQKLVQAPLAVQEGSRLTHEFSHFRLHIWPVYVLIKNESGSVAEPGQVWSSSPPPEKYGLPAPVQRILRVLADS